MSRSHQNANAIKQPHFRALGYRGPLARPWLRLGVPALAIVAAMLLAATAYAAARAIFPAPPAAPGQATRFNLAGQIEAADEASLTIAGITVDLGPGTSITGTPALGAAARATGRIGDDGALLAETIVVEAVAAAPTAPVAPTAAPTAAPAPPTAAPPAPAPPTAASTEAPAPPAPAPSGEPFARLRRLLEAGRADGRAGDQGDLFLAKLSEAEGAFAAGDAKKTGDQLRDLYQQLRAKAREGKADPAFAQEARDLLREIEATYGLRAIPNDGGGGGGGGGSDDDDDDDKEDKEDKDD